MPVPLHWHTEPFLLLTLLAFAWGYAICIGPLRAKIAPTDPLKVRHAVLFYAGLVLIYLAVGSPIDQLGEDYLFSVHMIQHVILIYFCPLLILRGLPTWLVDYFLRNRPLRSVVKVLVHPVLALPLFSFTYTIWHIPVLYEAALQNKAIHILEHWTMFLTATLFWWPLVSPSKLLPPMTYGARMLYVFFMMISHFPVLAFLTLSGEALYPTYVYAPRILPGLSALQDQILGGIIMNVVNKIMALTIFLLSWLAWYRSDDQAAAAMIDRFKQRHAGKTEAAAR